MKAFTIYTMYVLLFGLALSGCGTPPSPAGSLVTISSSVWISTHEVTQREYQLVMGENPSKFKGDDLPVENVSWYDAVAYCNKRSLMEGLTPVYQISETTVTWNKNAAGYRLPTEVEWEYAARGGSRSKNYEYAGSNNPHEVAWYYNNSMGTTHPVGTKAPNELGLYDMSGNVWEWCWDGWADTIQVDPPGHSSGSNRVRRGGGWDDFTGRLRLAERNNYAPSYLGFSLGFRVARGGLQ